MKRLLDLLLKYRRIFGWLYAILMLAFLAPTKATIYLGTPLVGLGLGLRYWASGCIEKNLAINWSGPYRYVRNPLYLGSFLLGLGFTLMANRWLLLLAFVGLYLTVYRHGVLAEEKFLLDKFGHSYARYMKHVPRFIPRPTPTRESGVGFRMFLALRHREYNAWLAVFAVFVAMLFALQAGWGVELYAAGRIFGS